MRYQAMAVMALGAILCTSATAGTINARCTTATQFTISAAGSHNAVYIRTGEGTWVPAEYETVDGAMRFHLDPAELGGPEIMLLIDPPADLVIDDTTAPQITGIKVDGRAFPARDDIHLGLSSEAPGTVKVGFADSENALNLQAVRAAVNGRSVEQNAISVTQIAPKKATITVDLGALDYGNYQATIRAQDRSPQQNSTTATISFDCFDTTNVLLAGAGGVEFSVDSCFANYESLEPLNDGFKELTGVHCRNDVSWASAEDPTEHWVEVKLDEPREISEVSVWWAYYQNTYHTSQDIDIRVAGDDGWKTIYSSPESGHPARPVTTFRFDPVKTDHFRIYQHPGGGAPGRADLMWIAEVEAR